MTLGFVAFIMFFSGFSAPAFESTGAMKRRLAWTELLFVGALLYAAFAWQYSHEIYHRVPQSFGGGKPERVLVEFDSSLSDIDLTPLTSRGLHIDRFLLAVSVGIPCAGKRGQLDRHRYAVP